MSEADEPKKLKSILKRQNSMMEPRMMHRMHPNIQPPYDPYQQYYAPPYGVPYLPSRHEPFKPRSMGGSYPNPNYGGYESTGAGYYEQENIYANRARIDLERRALPPIPGQSHPEGGSHLVRRHSLRDRRGGRYTPTSETGGGAYYKQYNDEPIYQSKRGSYMLSETREPNRRFDESPYQHRRQLHRNHLYQSKEEMQERIHQSRREFEKLSPDGTGSPTTPVSGDEYMEQKRRELKERGYRSKMQLREQIYQSRREAMETMAEPVYVTRRDLKRSETIHESKHEEVDDTTKTPDSKLTPKSDTSYKFPSLPPPPKSPPPPPPIQSIPSTSIHDATVDQEQSNHSTLKSSDNTVISADTKIDKAPLASIDSEDDDETIKKNVSDIEKAAAAAEMIKVSTPLTRRPPPNHISNIIKRTAAPEGTQIYASRTSMETQYISQNSLSIGPPNAQSTPFASDMNLPIATAPTPMFLPTVPREPITTRGIFDSTGGKLEDKLWNVTLVIPPGAIPAGVTQDIYFTVTDPRMAQQIAGGPPLDMENGWFLLLLTCFDNFIID